LRAGKFFDIHFLQEFQQDDRMVRVSMANRGNDENAE